MDLCCIPLAAYCLGPTRVVKKTREFGESHDPLEGQTLV